MNGKKYLKHVQKIIINDDTRIPAKHRLIEDFYDGNFVYGRKFEEDGKGNKLYVLNIYEIPSINFSKTNTFSVEDFNDLMNELYEKIKTSEVYGENDDNINRIIDTLMLDTNYMGLNLWGKSSKNIDYYSKEIKDKIKVKVLMAASKITKKFFDDEIVKNIVIKNLNFLISQILEFNYYTDESTDGILHEISKEIDNNNAIATIEANVRNVFKELNK